ncbi:MAG: hypothetical protein ACOCV1_07340, partial [Bacillota bacterium]
MPIITALRKEYLNKLNIPNDPSSLPFNDIFGDKWRIAIPIRNPQLSKLIDLLENGKTKSGNSYKVDLENQTAYRTVETRKGIKEISSRLGKTIGKELGQQWLNEFSRQMAYEDKNLDRKKFIILSRHPLDIVRMSDHSNITSCHSPPDKNPTGEDYFSCAFDEANDGGPIAYTINSASFDNIKDNLQDDEIFYDPDRNKTGITPNSRIRVNRYEHESGIELAVPTTKIYGASEKGFYDTLSSFLKSSQKNEIQNIKEEEIIDLDEWYRHGGSFSDRTDDLIFEKFLEDITVKGVDAEYIGPGSDESINLWEQELEILNNRASKLKHNLLIAYIEEGHAIYSHMLNFEFPNVSKENIP